MRRIAVTLGIAGLALTGVSVPTHADIPPGPDPGTARSELAKLTVASPHSMDGYSRDKFDIWAKQPDGCTTRQDVLKRDGKGVHEGSDGCQPTSGSWYSAYDGTTVTDVPKATIDHMVPLADAWRSGADKWSSDQRAKFGNDLTDPQLVVASESSNESKSDQDPSQWKPENKSFWCTYAEDWVGVKYKFQLNVTSSEKSALSDMLAPC